MGKALGLAECSWAGASPVWAQFECPGLRSEARSLEVVLAGGVAPGGRRKKGVGRPAPSPELAGVGRSGHSCVGVRASGKIRDTGPCDVGALRKRCVLRCCLSLGSGGKGPSRPSNLSQAVGGRDQVLREPWRPGGWGPWETARPSRGSLCSVERAGADWAGGHVGHDPSLCPRRRPGQLGFLSQPRPWPLPPLWGVGHLHAPSPG